ncbi:probable basic-leucine zipper transcription factor Q [Sitodiplosis mosellana]|uniref:probable basic-leucine zipper transcription factor Q n=1 Tax=Sitodiplosis mosellana TaxID=263140 RepID=UPI00244489CB|nr:probable basic-leucine zipper transcription factor Q [Sitodiplosis mosellana]
MSKNSKKSNSENQYEKDLKKLKDIFEKVQKKVQNYDKRTLTDAVRIEKYKVELLSTYNGLVNYVIAIYDEIDIDFQVKVLESLERAVEILTKGLKTLKFGITLPTDLLKVVDIEAKFVTNEEIDEVDKLNDSVFDENESEDGNLETNSNDTDEIINALKAGIKPENSKVVAGHLMALRADRANLTDFAKRAEELAESFQRSLVMGGTSRAKAIELSVDKAIDLCKANTSSTLVKSVLLSSKFDDAKEVIAKFTIETRNAVAENQILQFRSNRGRNNRGNANSERNWRNDSNGFRANGNRNNGWNNNRSNNGNNNNFLNNNNGSNGNSNANRGRGNFRSNYRGNGRNGQSSVNFFNSENGSAPPSGAQQVQIHQAE